MKKITGQMFKNKWVERLTSGYWSLPNNLMRQEGAVPFLGKVENGESYDLDISFGVMVSDVSRLDQVLRQSELLGEVHFIKSPESATKGLNKLLQVMEEEGREIAVLAHQDIYFSQDRIKKLKEQLAKLPNSWVVAGIIGRTISGEVAGHYQDMRAPFDIDTSDLHLFPVQASFLDECVLIFNLQKRFRFDEGLGGFHLYGSLCCYQAKEMGGTAWIIDWYLQHYILRSPHWLPDKEYRQGWDFLRKRFPKEREFDAHLIQSQGIIK